MPRNAFFPGSFNPFTEGHADIVDRGLRLFDSVVVGIGRNISKPDSEADAMDRLKTIEQRYAAEPRVKVVIYADLSVEAARRHDCAFMLRGARSCADFEYERNIADANRLLDPDIDTVILMSRPELSCISSSLLRELARYGRTL